MRHPADSNDKTPFIRFQLAFLFVAATLLTGLASFASPLAQAQIIPGTTFTVNSTSDADDGVCDSAHCSLREAINAANGIAGADTIRFSIAGSGPHSIALGSTLPAITEPAVIDGATQPGFAGAPIIEINGGGFARTIAILAGNSTIRGLVINRINDGAITLSGHGNVVEGNYIGTDLTGLVAQGNAFGGVWIASDNNRIGGLTPAARNVISGNSQSGIRIQGFSGNIVQGNYIGTDRTGSAPLPNDLHGVFVVGSANNTIGGTAAGAGNTIANNGGVGVFLVTDQSRGNTIRSNRIFANGGLGIVTSTTDLQSPPVVTRATSSGASTTVEGTLTGTAATAFALEFFTNVACDPSGEGEGESFLGTTTVTTDGNGAASFTATFPTAVPVGRLITGTTSRSGGNTSEFSQCTAVTASSGGSAAISIQPATAQVTVGGSTTLNLQLSGQTAPVGAWTVDVGYDPTKLKPTGCTPSDDSFCNTAFTATSVRVTGAKAIGLSSTQNLAGITFQAVGAPGAVATLTPTVVTLTDTAGDPMTATTSTGQVTISADTVTAITSSVNPSVFGQAVTFTATVSSGGSPVTAGSVTFKEGAAVLAGPTTLNSSGQATFTTATLTVASHTITAEYGGGGGFNPSSGNVTHQVTKASTATSVASSANPSVFGQSVTFTASVTVTAPGAGTPAGTVEFRDGATTLGTGTLSSGTATFATSALAVGARSITAVYLGNGDFTGSTSPALTQTVNQAATTTTVTSSANPSTFGQAVTFTASVSAAAPGAGTPSGTVTFKNGAATLGTGTLNPSGSAGFTTAALPVGSHSITAVHDGDTNFTGSTSPALTQTVNQASTSTVLASTANPSVFGQAVTFTATVNSGGSPVTAGSVTFKEGSTTLAGPTPLNSSGQASFTTAALTVGPHAITAEYSGSPSFAASSAGLTQTVNSAATSVTLTSSANPATVGQSVTFTAGVSVTAPGAGTPTGTVEFREGSTVLGTGTLSPSGTATFSTAALTAGTHAITAVYSGSGSFAGSTSPVLTQTVNSIQGDVNLDGQATAVDALCVLRRVAFADPDQAATTACPRQADTVYDVNGNGVTDPVDGLCVLRIVAGLLFTPDCPDRSAGGAGSAAARASASASASDPGTQAAGGGGGGGGSRPQGRAQVSVSPNSVRLAPNQSTTVSVQASAATGLGAWTVDITYDPAVVKVTGCTTAIGNAICNAAYKPNVIRIVGASATALLSTQTLANITFTAVGPANSSTGIDVSVPTLAEASGARLNPTTNSGAIRIAR